MDDRIKRALEVIEEWDNNTNPSGRNDIDTLYSLQEILSESAMKTLQGSLRTTLENHVDKLALPEWKRTPENFFEEFENEIRKSIDGEQTFLLENVSILSADFHSNKNYHVFYEKFGPELGGFPGIHRLVTDMARTMTDWEKEHGGSEAFETSSLSWPEASEKFVDAVISRSLKEEDLSPSADLEDIFQDLMEGETDSPSPR